MTVAGASVEGFPIIVNLLTNHHKFTYQSSTDDWYNDQAIIGK